MARQAVSGVRRPRGPARNLDPLFKPQSIAVVGAAPTSVGGHVLENIKRIGYRGRVYPVHPRHDSVHGLTCYPSLAALPEAVDAAVLATRAEAVPAALAEAGERGVRAAVSFAMGFAEAGAEGERRQREIQEIAARHGMLVCGPNCVGLFSYANACAMYVDVLPSEAAPGRIAAVSQSGTASIAAVTSGRIGLSHLVSIGNEAVIDAAEYMSYFVDDPQTGVIVAFLEGIRSPRMFVDVALRARQAGKPLVVLKVGASERAQAATVAHTGSLAGADEVFDGVCEQFGILRVHDFDEMFDTANALSLLDGRLPQGNRLGSITMSGGQVGMLLDLASEAGLAFDELGADARAALNEVLGRNPAISNPLDAGGTAGDDSVFADSLELIANDNNVDLLAVTSPALINWRRTAQTADLTIALSQAIEKPVMFLTSYAEAVAPAVRAPLDAAGVPVLPATRRGFGTIARCVRYAAHRSRRIEDEGGDRPPAREISPLLAGASRTLSEFTSFRILAGYGIPSVRHALVASAEGAAAMAGEIGFPVAVKACAASLSHKSDIGAVQVDLHDEQAVARAYDEVMTRVRDAGIAGVEGVLVAAMARGVEVIAGVSRDPDFGPTVIVGLGGTAVELLDDVSIRIAPVGRAEALAMLQGLRVAALLNGFRGAPRADVSALADVVVALSHLAVDHQDRIDAIDINPLMVSDAGAVAVDAMVMLADSAN